MAPNLAEVLAAVGALGALPAPATNDMSALLTEWSAFFQQNYAVDASPGQIKARADLMSTLLSAPNRAQELNLLQQACNNPLLGLALTLSAMPGTAVRQAQRWWDLMFTEQQDKGLIAGWNILPLSAPGPNRKYLIVSDLHRDAASDYVGAVKPGSINHFSKNEKIFQRILDFVTGDPKVPSSQIYTLIEAGDCEELWFVRSAAEYKKKADGSFDIADKVAEIVGSHPGIYSSLRALHDQGRYFRIYGNHDSFLRPDGADNSIGQPLRTFMEQDGTPFEIYDAILIDGVKTMMEPNVGDLLKSAEGVVADPTTALPFLNTLLMGHLGLDSDYYAETCRMLVAHGHQFDFWNSSPNEILGLLISNTVATFVDKNMDPFLDMRGVAWEGNPLFQFADLFSRWAVLNSWPAKMAAVRYAHEVQHTPNDQRLMADSIVFSETLAALFGTFGIALNYTDANGAEITPATSRKNLKLTTVDGIVTYLQRHHFHHLCLGHTHHPQNQPFLTLGELAKVAFPLAPVIKLIQTMLPDFLEPNLKTMYINSGCGGWMEGVIWGIEIDDKGQARLVYWTENSVGFEYMDWDLQPLPADVRANLLTGAAAALGIPVTQTVQSMKDVNQELKQRFAELNVPPAATASALARSATLPVYALALALMKTPPESSRVRQLQEPAGKLEQLKEEYDKLRSFTLDVLLSVKRRALSGFQSNDERETCVIRAPLSPSLRARLEQFKRALMLMGMSEDQALHYAALALSAFNEFPCNLPFFSSLTEPLNRRARLDESATPALNAMLSTLWMYPPSGQTVNVQGVALQSRFAVEGPNVSLTVMISKSAGGIA